MGGRLLYKSERANKTDSVTIYTDIPQRKIIVERIISKIRRKIYGRILYHPYEIKSVKVFKDGFIIKKESERAKQW